MNDTLPGQTPGDKLQGMTDGYDDPNRGPIDRAANALDGRDDPNRGPLDRAENALDGRDDPNRGPLDRAQNALDGHDDPNRGPLDRAANATTGQAGGVVSAIFDTAEEARAAVADLRTAGVPDSALSLIAQSGRTTTTSNVDGDVIDEEHTSILRGILGGGALGAGLGVAALAIPGVGPLVAAGAIASAAVPGAMAIGAAAGAALGTVNEVLKGHGIDDDDVTYYGERMTSGGTLVTVQTASSGISAGQAMDILHAAGGHNSARTKAM